MTTIASRKDGKKFKEQLDKARQQSIEDSIREEEREEEEKEKADAIQNYLTGGLAIGGGLSNSTTLNGNIGIGTGTASTSILTTTDNSGTVWLGQTDLHIPSTTGYLQTTEIKKRLVFMYVPQTDITLKEMAQCMEYVIGQNPKFITEDTDLTPSYFRHFLIENRDDDEMREVMTVRGY